MNFSSPSYSQSNSETERMVWTTKHLLGKAKDPYLTLLVYHDTLGVSVYSPAQLLKGRRLQMTMPKFEDTKVPQWPPRTCFHRRDTEI